MKRLICRLLGHDPKRVTRRGHLMNVDWTFGRETDITELICSRCGERLGRAVAS